MYLDFTWEYMINLFFDLKIWQATFYTKIFLFSKVRYSLLLLCHRNIPYYFLEIETLVTVDKFFCYFVILGVETIKHVICRVK